MEDGVKVYLVTVEDREERCALKYKDLSAVIELIKAFAPEFNGSGVFKLVSLTKGAVGVEIAQLDFREPPFTTTNNTFKEFLSDKMVLLDATRG